MRAVYYCERCKHIYADKTNIVRKPQTLPVKGEDVTVEAEVRVCRKCRMAVYDRELDERALNMAFAEYRRRHGFDPDTDLSTL